MSEMFRHQDSYLAIAIAWILAPLGFGLASFYLGSMWATPSILDMQMVDIQRGAVIGLAGFTFGVLFAIAVTVFYPPYINREFRERDEHVEAH